MEDDSTKPEFSGGERLGGILMGIFLMSFGMPFTLVPGLIVPEAISSGSILFGAFMVCFTLPFLIAGLAVQYAGFTAVRFALFPKSEKAREAFENGTIFSSTKKAGSAGVTTNYYASTTPAEKRVRTQSKHEDLAQPEPEKQTSNFWDNVEVDTP